MKIISLFDLNWLIKNLWNDLATEKFENTKIEIHKFIDCTRHINNTSIVDILQHNQS